MLAYPGSSHATAQPPAPIKTRWADSRIEGGQSRPTTSAIPVPRPQETANSHLALSPSSTPHLCYTTTLSPETIPPTGLRSNRCCYLGSSYHCEVLLPRDVHCCALTRTADHFIPRTGLPDCIGLPFRARNPIFRPTGHLPLRRTGQVLQSIHRRFCSPSCLQASLRASGSYRDRVLIAT